MFRFVFSIGFFLFFFALPTPTVAKPHLPVAAHTAESKLWGNNFTEIKSFETVCFFPKKEPVKKIEEQEQTATLPTWLEYAVPVPDAPEDAPMIAIVIDDLGLNRSLTRATLSLPAPITASFLSYADDLPEQTEKARLNGHELLLHAPMEPLNPRFDPGPDALRSEMSIEEITRNLEKMLNSFNGYVGINNHMGSKFTSDKQAIAVVMDELEKRGLLFLDSLTSGKSMAWKQARDRHIPYAVRDVFLDNAHNEEDILKQLALLEKHALKSHTAVAIGHPHKETINALKKWIPQAKAKGFVFVPISMIALIRQDAF